MPPKDPELSTDFLLGQISAQLRELIHGQNNTNTKIDALATRVLALEKAEERRTGASNLFTLILKSPALGWLVGAAITAWAILTGKVHVQ